MLRTPHALFAVLCLDRHGDDDAVLRWKNPILHACVRLVMTDCTGTHGGLAENEIECEAPDTGELVIPGAYLTLLEQGDWGQGECGGHDLERGHDPGFGQSPRIRP